MEDKIFMVYYSAIGYVTNMQSSYSSHAFQLLTSFYVVKFYHVHRLYSNRNYNLELVLDVERKSEIDVEAYWHFNYFGVGVTELDQVGLNLLTYQLVMLDSD